MASILLLIPTEFECSIVKDRIVALAEKNDTAVFVCGFGPVVAAAMATEQILRQRPSQVILCGIAGAYTNELQVGAAYEFSKVTIDGIGAGHDSEYVAASQMGWKQFAGDAERVPIGETIQVNKRCGLSLLSVCAASSDVTQANHRQQRFAAEAEDMEAFSVAAACQLQDVPLRVVRGVSNRAGIRDHSKWKINQAMHSAVEIVEQVIQEMADVEN